MQVVIDGIQSGLQPPPCGSSLFSTLARRNWIRLKHICLNIEKLTGVIEFPSLVANETLVFLRPDMLWVIMTEHPLSGTAFFTAKLG